LHTPNISQKTNSQILTKFCVECADTELNAQLKSRNKVSPASIPPASRHDVERGNFNSVLLSGMLMTNLTK